MSAAEADTVVIENTTIRGGDWGINALQRTTVFLSNSTIEDCGYGANVYTDSRLHASTSTFDGNYIGVFLDAGAGSCVEATVHGCTITNNGDGIKVSNVGSGSVAINDCTIDDNTTNGIYVLDDGDVSITRNTITGNVVGVYSYGSNPRIHSRNEIRFNTAGIKCDWYSTAVVESCTVTSNASGIAIINYSNPDIGHASGGSSAGYNILRPNSTVYLWNLTENRVMAERNYWPRNPPTQCNPNAAKILGDVDYDPHLGCSMPDLSAPPYMGPTAAAPTENVPTKFSLRQNYPNPFNPTTTIAYEVPMPGTRVEITLYDVAGRLVAVLISEHKVPGYYSVSWDGHNRHGEPVSSGVYFLRMRAGEFVDTKKLLLLK